MVLIAITPAPSLFSAQTDHALIYLGAAAGLLAPPAMLSQILMAADAQEAIPLIRKAVCQGALASHTGEVDQESAAVGQALFGRL